jgi:hypothetical protein
MKWAFAAALLGGLGLGRVGLAEAPARVVLCPESTAACQTATALGRGAGVRWVQLDDRALLAARPLPQLLYFSSQHYDEAMAGLTGPERAEAILRRREVVAGNLAGSLFEQLTSDLTHVATLAARTDLGILVEAAAALDGSQQRLRGASAGELLDMARQDLAELLVELPKGTLAEQLGKEADALGALVADVRKDAIRSRLPFAEPVRAYFVPALPEKQMGVLRELGAYPHAWRAGVVVLLGDHQLAEPPYQGKTGRALYPDRHDYLGDLTELTGPQLHRRLATRARQGYDHASFLARRAFLHAVLYRALTVQFEAAHVAWLAPWQKLVALDMDNLAQILATMGRKPGAAGTWTSAQLRADIALCDAILRAAEPSNRHTTLLARATESLSRLSK